MSGTLSINLATAEHLVTEGEQRIARHRRVIEALNNENGNSSDAIERARNVLTALEELQARRIANRDQLRRQLAKTEGAKE